MDETTTKPELKPTLYYKSINASPATTATLLLIHGASSSPTEYKLATPFFSANYHLLIPSLPGHHRSTHIQPFTLALATQHLAALIRNHAHNQHAHIVGVSLGAHVALHLAAQYPELILSVFVSGYGRLSPPPKWIAPVVPYVVVSGQRITDALPRGVVRYFMSGAALDLEGTQVCNVRLAREVIAVLCARDEVRPVKARCLVVAATKRGIVPSDDSVEDARGAGRVVQDVERGGSAESRVVQMRSMRHPWDMQAPELFARCVVAWVEGRELPGEMEEVAI